MDHPYHGHMSYVGCIVFATQLNHQRTPWPSILVFQKLLQASVESIRKRHLNVTEAAFLLMMLTPYWC